MNKKINICRVASVPFFVKHHLKNQINAAVNEGYSVTVVCSFDADAGDLNKIFNKVNFKYIKIPRSISPISDLIALCKLWWFFRKNRFDIIHSVTPKAGLLTAIASYFAFAPVRIHTFTGQVWQTKTGKMRMLLKLLDKLTVSLNTRCYADSFSQRDFLIGERVASSHQLSVVGQGSLAGVDTEHFSLKKFNKQNSKSIYQKLNIPESSFIINFTGRICVEKGVRELIRAFSIVSEKYSHVFLLLVGPIEDNDLANLAPDDRSILDDNDHIKKIGYFPHPEVYFGISDLLCLPSYREGFGNVVIEAASMGIPCVASRIDGLIDSVKDGETGILVEPRDHIKLAQALEVFIKDEKLKYSFGAAAQARARKMFDINIVNGLMMREYESAHSKKSIALEYSTS